MTREVVPAGMDGLCRACGGHIRAGDLVKLDPDMNFLHSSGSLCEAHLYDVREGDRRFLRSLGIQPHDFPFTAMKKLVSGLFLVVLMIFGSAEHVYSHALGESLC